MHRHSAVIVGAGFGGLGTAIQLKRAGIEDFVILEANPEVGGTWFNNAYPGCACDVPSRLYWFSFVEQPDWSRTFASRDEIFANIRQLVATEGLAPHLRLGSRMVSARWDEATTCWEIVAADGTVYSAPILVCAVGQLSHPQMPAISGMDDFAGTVIHSASWSSDITVEGQRVAVIGTGASAIQIVPEIASCAKQVTVFQRSAPYVMPKDDRVFSAEERELYGSSTEVQQAERAGILGALSDILAAFEPGSDAAAGIRQVHAKVLADCVPDARMRASLTPADEFGCKRPLQSSSYYQAFSRPNVTLETAPIARMVRNGIEMADGRIHSVDIVVHATGFNATQFLLGIEIVGRAGVSLQRDAWRDAPEAHKGITLAGFPGLFLVFGPNTNFISVLAIIEHQIDFIVRAVLRAHGEGKVFEPCPDRQRAFNDWLQHRLRDHSPYGSGCRNYYQHPSGRITSNWWGTLDEYAALPAHVDEDEYIFHQLVGGPLGQAGTRKP